MEKSVYLINCPPIWLKCPPLGLEHIRQYLTQKGYTVEIIDLNIIIYELLKKNKKEWLSLNKDFEMNLFYIIEKKYPEVISSLIKNLEKTSFVGFSLFKRNREMAFLLAECIKKRYPEKTIVFGGPEVLFMRIHQENLSPTFKWIIGEGEKSLETLLIENKRNIIEYEETDNLDELPFLDFKKFDLGCYDPSLPLVSSKGCIRKCRFCTENLLYKSFRQHSPLYMVDQIDFLIRTHKICNFTFQDSLINANLSWLQEFCSIIIRRGLKINWEAQAIVRKDFDTSLAALLKESGCFNLFIGLESASDTVLKYMNKGFIKEDAVKFFSNLRKANLHFEISLIFGHIGEEEKDFKETIDFIIKNKKIIPKIAQANPFVNYFLKDYNISREALERTNKFIDIIKKEKIPYTKSFINNLVYTRCR